MKGYFKVTRYGIIVLLFVREVVKRVRYLNLTGPYAVINMVITDTSAIIWVQDWPLKFWTICVAIFSLVETPFPLR